jgi:7-keto-8-aminopelargonate synthetase-like enzyme
MKSNSYVFGGPVPPPYLEAICVACDIVDSPEHASILRRLNTRIARLIAGLDRLRLTVLGRQAPIVSILVNDEERTLRAGKWLFDHGFYVQSVVFPAVAFNQGVLRIQVNANHSLHAIDALLDALERLRKEIRLPEPAPRKG